MTAPTHTLPPRIQRRLVDTRLGQIHCRIAGPAPDASAPALILFHINQQSSALGIELLEALAPGVHGVAMDYPGCGMSDHIPFQPSIADYADCGAEVMQALGFARYTAMGEATGAAVAAEMSARHRAAVQSVVLVNCPIYKDNKQAHEVHRPLKDTLRPADASGFPMTRTLEFMREKDPTHAPMNPDQSWMDRINVAQLETGRDRWQALDALNAYDIKAGLEAIPCPTLLMMGEHFHYTSLLEQYTARLRHLTQARVIQNARFCMVWEKAQELAAHVRPFLGQHGAV